MSLSTTPIDSGAQLVILRFASCQQKKEHHNNAQAAVHYVVKGTPFLVDFGLAGSFDRWVVDFYRFNLECVLLYDLGSTANNGEPVHFIKEAPIEWKTVRVDETGERMTAEIKANALSSKHEDACFRIRFRLVPPKGVNVLPLQIVSEPLRVVSKVALVKQNTARGPQSRANSPQRGQKRTLAEVEETVCKLEREQKAQQLVLQTLLQTISLMQKAQMQQPTQSGRPTASASVVGGPLLPMAIPNHLVSPQQPAGLQALPPSPMPLVYSPTTTPNPQTDSHDFEAHLMGLVASYNRLPVEERATKIRKIVHNPDTAELSTQLVEIMDAVWLEGLTEQG